MLKIEKYKEELIESGIICINKLAVKNNKPERCVTGYCLGCDFDPQNCKRQTEDWLFSEYKEPEVDWSKVKVDTPILVRDYETQIWIKCYFARYEDGKVYGWMGGATSWSVDDENDVYSWEYAKLAEREEQEDV